MASRSLFAAGLKNLREKYIVPNSPGLRVTAPNSSIETVTPLHIQLQEIELEAKIGLLGDNNEQETAVALLLKHYGRPIMAYLRARFSSLSPHDCAEAVHDALIAVHKNAQGMGNDDKPIAPFLFTIACRSAIDILRKAASRIITDDELTDEIADRLRGTATGQAWDRLKNLDLVKEVQADFRNYVTTLKGQQRFVGSILADNLADQLSDSEIAEEIFKRTGTHISTMQVKGAKAALLQKFRTLIAQKTKP